MLNAEGRTPRRLGRRDGFSFTEILFAVMILGIGFIMVAAMFPVAIRQTEAGNQETIAAAVGRSSSNYLAELAAMPLPPGGITGYTPANSTQLPSILLPTIVQVAPPVVTLPPASSFTLPVGQTSMVVPGQVWTMYDNRDPWVYTFSVGGSTLSANHNSVLWQSIARNLILPGDLRFGWAAMYRRDVIVRGTPGGAGTSIAPATFAQVIVIGMQSRNKPVYDPTVDLSVTTPPPTPFVPRLIGLLVSNNGAPSGTGLVVLPPAFSGGPSYIDFGTLGPKLPPMLADNTYVVLSDDNVPWGRPSHGALNGRIFRIGMLPSAGTACPLLPGSDMTPSDYATLNNMQADLGGPTPVTQSNIKVQFNVLIVGRGPTATGPFGGPAQEVTAYTTFLPIAN
ncbi:MAG TPA: hypothetical protein VGI81_01090 [Tepidisphaeraceae bacterium]|jgi:hypothetical protein